MLKQLQQTTEQRMVKTIETLKQGLSRLRTGRAQPSLLENVLVASYGIPTPLSQVASITTEGTNTLLLTPWDKSLIPAIEKAIFASDLGLNPMTAGTIIRVPLPPLTEERRKELIKHVRTAGEESRVAIRNIRRDANGELKDLLEKKEISEDEARRGMELIQKLTDRYISEVEATLSHKESELLTL